MPPQHDMDLANQAGAAFRADANGALGALVTNSSGATEPSVKFAFQWWADTSTGRLKQRNAANNAWITVLNLETGIGVPQAPATGQVLQVTAATDAGSSTTFTVMANLSQSGQGLTPKSATSHILIEVQFYGSTGIVPVTNTYAQFQIYDITNSVLIGAANSLSVVTESTGGQAQAPCCLRAYVANTVLTNRQWALRGLTSNAGAAASALSMVWSFTEIKD